MPKNSSTADDSVSSCKDGWTVVMGTKKGRLKKRGSRKMNATGLEKAKRDAALLSCGNDFCSDDFLTDDVRVRKAKEEICDNIEGCMRALWDLRECFFEDLLDACLLGHRCECSGKGNPSPAWGKVTEIICYGVGNFAVPFSSAMLQMACVLLLRQTLTICQSHEKSRVDFSAFDSAQILSSSHLVSATESLSNSSLGGRIKMSFFDPCSTPLERLILQTVLNVKVIRNNERGKRKVNGRESRTVFFMPHCPMRLYSNVIWANWDEELLTGGSVVIVGNSFRAYHDRTISSKASKDESNCVFRILPFVTEQSIVWKQKRMELRFGNRYCQDNLKHVESAFNDFSVMWFLSTRVYFAKVGKDSNVGSFVDTSLPWPDRPEEYFVPAELDSNNCVMHDQFSSVGELI